MGHFAKVKSGVVVQVIVAEEDFIETLSIKEDEKWLKTSYNIRGGIYYDSNNNPVEDQSIINEDEGRKRKNYAGIGDYYDEDLDAFIPKKTFPSWILNKNTCLWEAPVPYPEDEYQYIWDERNIEWVFTGHKLKENGKLELETEFEEHLEKIKTILDDYTKFLS